MGLIVAAAFGVAMFSYDYLEKRGKRPAALLPDIPAGSTTLPIGRCEEYYIY